MQHHPGRWRSAVWDSGHALMMSHPLAYTFGGPRTGDARKRFYIQLDNKKKLGDTEEESGNCEAPSREAEGSKHMSKPEMYASVWDAIADTKEQAANLRGARN